MRGSRVGRTGGGSRTFRCEDAMALERAFISYVVVSVIGGVFSWIV
jgi:hypothetical protein